MSDEWAIKERAKPSITNTLRALSVMAALSARSANMRHLITASFYLFGIVFFWGLRFALWTPDSKTPVGILVLENFFLYFAFAANALFVFLILHLVQWFVSARLQACARYLATLHIA